MHIVAVGGLVTNEDDLVLLVKSPRRGWEFPGGQVEVGESLPQALMREIREESGVTVRVENVVGIYSNTASVGADGRDRPTIVNIDFICRYIDGDLTPSEESVEVGWFTKDKALKLVTYPVLRERFANMLGNRGAFQCCAFGSALKFFEEYAFPQA